MDRLKSGGLTLGNLMIAGFPNTRYGRPGRDEEIEKVQQSIRAAGRAGLPVVEYNFYAHRLVEGYDAETGRAGAGLTAFDYSRVKDLPPLEPGVKPKAFAVTVEPAGGVPKPTGRMVMVGTVS
jgi:mannonate dehydratase